MAAHPLEEDPYQSLWMLCLGVHLFIKYLVRVYHVTGFWIGSGHTRTKQPLPSRN